MDEDERIELLRRLFAVLTAMLEDAAALAVEGQGRKSATAYSQLAERIHSVGGQVVVITDAAAALANRE